MNSQSFDAGHVNLIQTDYDYSVPRLRMHDSKGTKMDFEEWRWRSLTGEDKPTAKAPASEKREQLFLTQSSTMLPATGYRQVRGNLTADAGDESENGALIADECRYIRYDMSMLLFSTCLASHTSGIAPRRYMG